MSYRLLLIEDDYDIAEMLTYYFKLHHCEIIHADDGESGVELAQSVFPNLVLLDIMLPDMDGYDVCAQLRRRTLTKYIPILFLTQKDERVSKVRGLELGADDYITKPFDPDELRLRVQRSIRRATADNLQEARTGLPTGTMIEDEISHKLAGNKPFKIFSYRLAGFESYHDAYGFVAANEVLHRAGQILQKAVRELGTPNDFIGIVENEFILLTHAGDESVLDNAAKLRFAQEVTTFYSFIDAEQGGIVLRPGTPDEEFVPLMRVVSQMQSLSGAG